MSQTIKPVPDAVILAARHVAVSSRDAIGSREFMAALSGQDASRQAHDAVATFLYEADPAELADIVAEGAASFSRLNNLAVACLPVDHPNRVYLADFGA